MYLRRIDYLPYIQDATLAQIITNNDSIRLMAELSAEEELISYLKQKYDTIEEFSSTTVYDPQKSYNVFDLVYLDGTAWVGGSYPVNSIVVLNSLAYIALTNTATSPIAQVTDWFYLGNQYDLFSVSLPVPEFEYNGSYGLNDTVFWKNSIWVCQYPTIIESHFSDLQAAYIERIGVTNIAPDDIVNKTGLYWTKQNDYTLAAGVLPTDINYWTKGDNRSELLKMYMIYITIYRVTRRISPKNVPERYEKDYNESIMWLQKAADGVINAPLPLLAPKQGNRTRYGGMVKSVNYY